MGDYMSLIEKLQIYERKNYFQLIFIHFPLKFDIFNPDEDIFWNKIYTSLKEDGTLWIIINDNQLASDRPIQFKLVELLQSQGFYIRNIILWYNKEYENSSSVFKNRISYILFISKSRTEYKFHLDAIREPHIWKDFEWGKGRRSRYNPLGKNPSNFWIHVDSKQGKTIGHKPLQWYEVAERIIRCSTDEGDSILCVIPSNRKFMTNEYIQKINIKLITLDEDENIVSPSFFNLKEMKTSLPFPNSDIYHKVYFKSSERLDEVENDRVQIVVTSPPYWGLRDYGVTTQIGYHESYEEYLSRLKKVFKELFRVLKPDGLFWLNINKRIINGQMLLIPSDLLKICRSVGFIFLDVVIWFRPISVPGLGDKNFTDRYEFILVFAKSQDVKINTDQNFADFLCESPNSQINVWKLYRGIGNLNADFRKKATTSIKHTAVFPEELVKRAILVSTIPGDVVLDPFLGSGTTLSIATRMERSCIGYEINPDFKPLIEKRLVDSISLSHFIR